ncbi:MAG: catechol 2,3-dioxygenase-like lactoylglutathione lyase family enzyme [Myxococcota bacterium]|jgi:catechol 2,3-dioxygenase-like lactoylglutathione lyase family enzyme
MPPRIHLSLRVSELSRSVAFYQQLLGTAPDKQHDDYARFMPKGTPILLSLVPGAGQAGAGRVDHLGCACRSRRRRLQRGSVWRASSSARRKHLPAATRYRTSSG